MVKINNIIAILIFINLVLSGYIIYEESKSQAICVIGSTCNQVQSTSYGYILGIPLAWIGLLAFVILLGVFYLSQKNDAWKNTFFYLTLLGGLYAIYLIIVQAFVLKAFCSLCMMIDPIMVIIFVLELVKKHILK